MSNHKEIIFSESVKNMCRDSECTFGILKQLWIILKSSDSMHSLDLADTIFKPYYVSHNFLLQADDMDVPWDVSKKYDFDDKNFEDCNENNRPI